MKTIVFSSLLYYAWNTEMMDTTGDEAYLTISFMEAC